MCILIYTMLRSLAIRKYRQPATLASSQASYKGSYFGLNDFNLRWVALANWTYTTKITGL